jgi:hypothetical protein
MVAYQFLAKHIQILDQSVEVPRDTVIELIVLVFKTLNSEELNNLRHFGWFSVYFSFFFCTGSGLQINSDKFTIQSKIVNEACYKCLAA